MGTRRQSVYEHIAIRRHYYQNRSQVLVSALVRGQINYGNLPELRQEVSRQNADTSQCRAGSTSCALRTLGTLKLRAQQKQGCRVLERRVRRVLVVPPASPTRRRRGQRAADATKMPEKGVRALATRRKPRFSSQPGKSTWPACWPSGWVRTSRTDSVRSKCMA
jgi:hypothetical protein